MSVTIARGRKALGCFLVAVVTLAVVPAPATRAQTATVCSTSAVGFDELEVDRGYAPGESFRSGVAEVSVDQFTYSDGRLAEGGFASADADPSHSGGTGLDLQVNNVLLRFGFGVPSTSELDLRFGEFGGNVNLDVNGVFHNLDDFAGLNGTSIGGVLVSVEATPDGIGTMTLEGNISSFAIGGQELWIDEIVADPMCPDLAIGPLSSDFRERGRLLTVRAVIENQGDADSPAADVTLSVDDWGSRLGRIDLLAAGKSTSITLEIDVPPDLQGRTVSAEVTVDPDDAIDENIPTNNTGTIDVGVPGIDLALTVSATVLQDDVLVITGVVTNQGRLVSRPTTVVAVAESGEWRIAPADVPRLRRGRDAPFSLELPIPRDQRGRTITFLVTVDPDHVGGPELDDSNNSANTTADIPLAPIPPVDETAGAESSGLWIIIAAAAAFLLVMSALIRRLLRKPPRALPELVLRAGQPEVRVTPRPDGSPRHTVELRLKPGHVKQHIVEGRSR